MSLPGLSEALLLPATEQHRLFLDYGLYVTLDDVDQSRQNPLFQFVHVDQGIRHVLQQEINCRLYFGSNKNVSLHNVYTFECGDLMKLFLNKVMKN